MNTQVPQMLRCVKCYQCPWYNIPDDLDGLNLYEHHCKNLQFHTLHLCWEATLWHVCRFEKATTYQLIQCNIQQDLHILLINIHTFMFSHICYETVKIWKHNSEIYSLQNKTGLKKICIIRNMTVVDHTSIPLHQALWQGCTNPGWPNYVQWCLTFMGELQYGTSFMSPFQYLEFWGGS